MTGGLARAYVQEVSFSPHHSEESRKFEAWDERSWRPAGPRFGALAPGCQGRAPASNAETGRVQYCGSDP